MCTSLSSSDALVSLVANTFFGGALGLAAALGLEAATGLEVVAFGFAAAFGLPAALP